MDSQDGDSSRRRRRHKSKPKSNARDEQPLHQSSRPSAREGRNSSKRADARHTPSDRPPNSTSRPGSSANGSARPSRAASPSALTASVPIPSTSVNSNSRAGFSTGADFIAFDFSDGEDHQGDNSANHSPGKDEGKARGYTADRDRKNGLKRTASQMEAEDDGYSNKKQRLDAASRLTPWAEDVEWDSCRNIAEMMHKEVKAFVTYISPRPEEHEVRSMVIATITGAIRGAWPDAQVLPFGSFETKLYLPLGDIDLVIQSRTMEHYEKRQILYNLAQVLRKANITNNVTVIAKAKVPIVKFVTSHGRFAVDISLNQDNGVVSGRIVNRFLLELPALRSLVMVIKLFLSQRSMNEVYTGGLGSYAIVCMAISFLQIHPKIRSAEIDPFENMGVLVMEFFELYGHHFNYDNTGISIRDGGTYFNKSARGWSDYRQTSLLSIEDPNDITNDISKSSYNITRVRKTLAGAYEVLATTALMRSRVLISKAQGQYTRLRPFGSNDREYDNPSILGSVLGVTQETLNHRRMVQQLYEQSTLQNLLGLAPYRPIHVISDGESAPSRSRATYNHASTSRSAKAVESAWGEADMDFSESDEDPAVRRQPSPEAEESRYSSRHPKKRRRLDPNGKNSNLQNAIFVAESEDEEPIVLGVTQRARSEDTEESMAPSARDVRNDRKRAYWASKGMGGAGLDDSD